MIQYLPVFLLRGACAFSLWLVVSGMATGQAAKRLTLEACYSAAEQNYPLVKQYALVEKSKDFSLMNVTKGTFPQFTVNGQATYQSAVTALPISLPNVDIPALSKSQYRFYAEASQSLTDLYIAKHQRELVQAGSVVENHKIEVELYTLRDRINQLYFGILLLDAQIKQTEILQKDIQSGANKNRVAIANGIALRSSADVLQAENLKSVQRKIELQAARKGYLDMLSLLVNQNLDEHTELVRPQPVMASAAIKRPELRLFDMQRIVLDVQKNLIDTKTLPRFNLFIQAGLGRPALNMLNGNSAGYYLGGLRLLWNLSALYTNKQEKQLLTLNQNVLDIQREIFVFNTGLLEKQHHTQIDKWNALLETDSELIRLRENIKLSAQSQLENGTSTTNDYLTYVNAEDQARQNRIIHEIQLLSDQYHLKTVLGN